MPVPSAWTGSLLEWAKAVAGCEADPRSPIAEGRLAAWLNLQRGGQVEARARIYHRLAVECAWARAGVKSMPAPVGPASADGGDGNRFAGSRGCQ